MKKEEKENNVETRIKRKRIMGCRNRRIPRK